MHQGMTMRAIGLRIMPLLMVGYLIASVDRVNVGFAALASGSFHVAMAPLIAMMLAAFACALIVGRRTEVDARRVRC